MFARRTRATHSALLLVVLLANTAAMIEGWFGLGGKQKEPEGGEPQRIPSDSSFLVGCLPACGSKTLGRGNIIEYRLPMPYDLHAAEKGKKFAVAKMSEEEDDGGGNKAVELVFKENGTHPVLGITGVHTRKLYHIGQRLPLWVRAMLPGLNFDLEEEAWTLGPHGEITLVDMRLPMLPNFRLNMRTVNLLGPPIDDAHRLGSDVLKRREVINMETEGDKLVAYKLVEVVFPYLGLQQRAEALIKDSQMNIFRNIDKIIRDHEETWRGMSDEEVDAVLSESYEKLKGPAALAHEASYRSASPYAQGHDHRDLAECEARGVAGGAANDAIDPGKVAGPGDRRVTHEQALQAYYDFTIDDSRGGHDGTCRQA